MMIKQVTIETKAYKVACGDCRKDVIESTPLALMKRMYVDGWNIFEVCARHKEGGTVLDLTLCRECSSRRTVRELTSRLKSVPGATASDLNDMDRWVDERVAQWIGDRF